MNLCSHLIKVENLKLTSPYILLMNKTYTNAKNLKNGILNGRLFVKLNLYLTMKMRISM